MRSTRTRCRQVSISDRPRKGPRKRGHLSPLRGSGSVCDPYPGLRPGLQSAAAIRLVMPRSRRSRNLEYVPLLSPFSAPPITLRRNHPSVCRAKRAFGILLALRQNRAAEFFSKYQLENISRMSRSKTKKRQPKKQESDWRRWVVYLLAVLVIGAVAAGVVINGTNRNSQPTGAVQTNPAASPASPAPPKPQATTTPLSELVTMDVAKAVMVTDELDFGGRIPTIAEALQQIERRYTPDDGQGRTFAVLDAYGEPTADGKLLHLSMHVSSEKPGMGELVFKRTGKSLWRAKINPTSQPPAPKTLSVLIDNGGGKTLTVDGSSNPSSVLMANSRELGIPIQNVWADGTEREVTFIYSACGCPVKVMVKRVGDRTVRTKDTPVIFPDDPAAVAVISKLMRW